MRDRKYFIGQVIRELRDTHNLTQAAFAQKLSISTSYLNQIENNQRHVTANVLLGLAEVFDVNIASLADSDSDRLLADMTEALADPLFKGKQPTARDLKLFTQGTPTIARAFLDMHQALRNAGEQLAEIDNSLVRSGALDEPTPYEEVRDFFHYKDNYIDELDKLAETLAKTLSKADDNFHDAVVGYLLNSLDVRVVFSNDPAETSLIRAFDAKSRVLTLNKMQPRSTHVFQMGHLIAQLMHKDVIERISAAASFQSTDAQTIAQIGLANYFSGALVMPYSAFLQFAHDARHDLQIIANHFEASLEQVGHRLSTLQRPGKKGIPFFFARVDQAGNITKRHSATRLQFARFGSTCPLWNVHSAFASPGRMLRQLATTPDGARYICLSTEITKQGAGFRDPIQRYAIALGCEVQHAEQIIYADDLDTRNEAAFEPIGVSCRICERPNCHQRATPPLKRALQINTDRRDTIPYSLG